jgi:integrase
MAWVSKRSSDKARGKQGRYTCFWRTADGRVKSCVGVTDRAVSQRIANQREVEAREVREGTVDLPARARREAAARPVAEHVAEYRDDLLSRRDTPKHAKWAATAVLRLLKEAGVVSIARVPPEKVRAAIGRMKAAGRSARTCNSYLTAVKSFLNWCAESDRIDEVPRGLKKSDRFNEKDDRRRVRRALSVDELARLLAATEAGPPIVAIRGPVRQTRAEKGDPRILTGPERAAIYRLAMGTGFRANEIRTLIVGSFRLDGPEPSVALLPRNEKNRKGAVQPIRRDLAAILLPFLDGRDPDETAFHVPRECAPMLRADLERAGIPYRDAKGRVVDFHSLRGSFVTHLILGGVNPKVVQKLARHSTIVLTMDIYATIEDSDMRKAIEGE